MRRHGDGIHHWLPWLGLAAALSPVLLDLASELPRIPFGWSLGVPVLLVILAWRDGERVGPRPLGLVGVAVGLVLMILGLLGNAASLARLSLPVAATGMALWTRALAPRVALLLVGCVPIPTFLYVATTPHAEAAWAAVATALVSLWEPELVCSGPVVRAPGGSLELHSFHSGLHAAAFGALLAWWAALRLGWSWLRALGLSAFVALFGIPAQIVASILAISLLAAGSPAAAELTLDPGLWLVATGTTLRLVHGMRTRSAASGPRPPGEELR